MPRLPAISWQIPGEVHAGSLLQLNLTKFWGRLLLTFSVTFSQVWRRQVWETWNFPAGQRSLYSKYRSQKGKEKILCFSSKNKKKLSSLWPNIWLKNKIAERKLLRALTEDLLCEYGRCSQCLPFSRIKLSSRDRVSHSSKIWQLLCRSGNQRRTIPNLFLRKEGRGRKRGKTFLSLHHCKSEYLSGTTPLKQKNTHAEVTWKADLILHLYCSLEKLL